MYLSRPLTTLEEGAPPLIIDTFIASINPCCLWNNLNPVMFPCMEFAGGNCQDAVMLVEELAIRVKLLGACEGTEIKKITTYKFADNLY